MRDLDQRPDPVVLGELLSEVLEELLVLAPAVAIALTALVITPVPLLGQMGLVAAATVVVAVCVALTLTPALLHVVGRRVISKRAWAKHAARPDTDQVFGSSYVGGVTKRPALVVLAVAMMVLPMICAVMREVFSQAPPGEREAALALGSTRWGMVRSVVLPFGRGGIIGGTMLGLGRALGETIAVVLIINQAEILKPRVIETGTNTISALIATKFSDASEAQLSALLSAGLVLFIITLIINTLASIAVSRSRSGADADA